MQVTERQFYMLKDIHVITKVGSKGGCLPLKDALIYDPGELKSLQDGDYVKAVTLMMPCGGEIRGFKLTHKGEWALRKLEAQYKLDALDAPTSLNAERQCLTPEQVDTLRDIYHFCRLRKSGGIFPRKEAEAFAADDLEFLYLHGYILKIQSGDTSGRKEKGFILSNKGEDLVRNVEESKDQGAGS
ncbi:MAG: hypothetical protein EA399_15915 [Desulfovibrionales bacterium]|nr:MAG: hypothetical protein EA399_15915 [Desulfovibrionales bacterium]